MYVYAEERAALFTDEGQRMLLRVRDRAQKLLKEAGCFDMGHAIQAAGSGNSWTMMACVDRLVEIGEIREIDFGKCAGQYRIFVSARND